MKEILLAAAAMAFFIICPPMAAVGLCVLTDIFAALLLSGTGWKASLETAVIAGFVLLGVKGAPFVSRLSPQ